MIPVTSYFNKAIVRPNRDMRCKASINGLNLVDDDILSFKITDSLSGMETFSIGGVSSTYIEITLSNATAGVNRSREYTGTDFSDFNFENQELTLWVGIQISTANGANSRNIEYCPMGVFIIEEVLKDDKVKTITLKGYDRMIKFETPYVSTLTYPAMLATIYAEVTNLAGVPRFTEGFINQTQTVSSPIVGYTLRQALGFLASASGNNAVIDRYGRVELRDLGSSSVVTVDKSNYFELSKAEKATKPIDKVTIKNGTILISEGTGTSEILIANNPFIENPSAALPLLADKLMGITYSPFKCRWNGNPCVEVGDKITVSDGINNYSTYVTNQSIEYQGGFKCTSEALGLSNVATETASQGTIKANGEKNSADIVQTKAELIVLGDSIQTKVSKGTELNDEISTQVIQNAESWNLSIDGKLKGKTYTFTGDGFTIGGSDAGSSAMHTNQYSQWLHNNGGYTYAGVEGFKYVPDGYDGDKVRLYTSLIDSDTVDVSDTTMSNDIGTYLVTLPEVYRNKDFKVLAYFESIGIGLDPQYSSLLVGYQVWISAWDYQAPSFEIKYMLKSWDIALATVRDVNNNEIVVPRILQANGARDVQITWIVFA